MEAGVPKEIAEIAAKPGLSKLEEGAQIALVPRGPGQYELQSVKKFLDEYRGAPERVKGTAAALTLDAFCQLVNRHKDEHTAIFADMDPRKPALLAVVDYTTTDHKPRFHEHRVAYQYPISEEWQAWLNIDGKTLSQADFAAFIEDHLPELVMAGEDEERVAQRFQTKIALPIDLLQLSRGLAMTVESKVGEVRSLQSGEAEIVFSEVHTDGRGQKLTVPGLFVVEVPVFAGDHPARLIARLRYRRRESAIVWSVHFWRWEQAVRDVLAADVETIEHETSLPVYQARPEGVSSLR